MNIIPDYKIHTSQLAAFSGKIKHIQSQINANNIETAELEISNLINEFERVVGGPITEWDMLVDGDPPRSEKLNRFFADVQIDINILQNQIDVLQAAAISVHNTIKTDILQLKGKNAETLNKLKTLQLYSSAIDDSVVIFSDSFMSDELIDGNALDGNVMGLVDGTGYLTLNKVAGDENPLAGAEVRITRISNGIPGDNLKLASIPAGVLRTKGNKLATGKIKFTREITGVNANINSIIDSDPTSWFEFEAIKINDVDRWTTANLNLAFKGKLVVDKDNFFNFDSKVDGKIKWGGGPTKDTLKLGLNIALKSPSFLNTLSLAIHEFADKGAHPVKISKIEISENGTVWKKLNPTETWLTTRASLTAASVDANVAIGRAVWNFDNTLVKYIRFVVSQYAANPVKIGHIYYEQNAVTETKTITKTDPETGEKTTTRSTVTTPKHRVEGPLPEIYNPGQYDSPESPSKDITKDIEVFDCLRWAIGVRDFTAGATTYGGSSAIISKQFDIAGIIDRVAIESEVLIPESFSSDETWVRFFVSPDDGSNWYEISRVEDNYSEVPEILAFNDPTPEEFREQNVGYYNVDGTVTSLRVKIELYRPDGEEFLTPRVGGYKLKIRKR